MLAQQDDEGFGGRTNVGACASVALRRSPSSSSLAQPRPAEVLRAQGPPEVEKTHASDPAHVRIPLRAADPSRRHA